MVGGGELVRTALYDAHAERGGHLVDFHGFELPIWYSSITEEHLATRASAGLFDVSHMGFFRFSGESVREWFESLATQAVSRIEAGCCAYTHFLDQSGVIIDDMIFSVVDRDTILGVPNASMVGTMRDWFDSHLPPNGSITLEDISEVTSILALQGPASPSVLAQVLGEGNVVRRFKGQAISENPLGINGWIQGTGYTGERGFEIFVSNDQVLTLWNSILDDAGGHGVVPVGLGARDTLRMEKGYLLSGQDFLWPGLADDGEHAVEPAFLARDSWETNVPFGLDLEHHFIGKQRVLESQSADGARWWGVKYLERGPFPRTGSKVLDMNGEDIGIITSGGPSPSLGKVGIGIGYIEGVEEGSEVLIAPNPRKQVRAQIVRTPFV